MRGLGFGLVLVAGLTLGCGKFGPPVRNLPPEPIPVGEEPAASPAAEEPAASPAAEGPAASPATEAPAEPPAP